MANGTERCETEARNETRCVVMYGHEQHEDEIRERSEKGGNKNKERQFESLVELHRTIGNTRKR